VVALNDLEQHNGPYVAFHRIRVQCRRKTIIIGLSRFQNLEVIGRVL